MSLGSTPRKIASLQRAGLAVLVPDGRLADRLRRRRTRRVHGVGPTCMERDERRWADRLVDARPLRNWHLRRSEPTWSTSVGSSASSLPRTRFALVRRTAACSPTLKGRRLEVRAARAARSSCRRRCRRGSSAWMWVAPNARRVRGPPTASGIVSTCRSGRITRFDLGALGLNTVRTGHRLCRSRRYARVHARTRLLTTTAGPLPRSRRCSTCRTRRSLVYQSYCAEAFDNLHQVNPDGTGLAPHHDRAEATSRAGALAGRHGASRSAQSDYNGLSCKGCAQLRCTRRYGWTDRATTALTTPARLHVRDSAELVARTAPRSSLSHCACDTAPDAMVVAAAGGTPTEPPPPCVDGRVGTHAIGLREWGHRPVVVVDVAPRRHRQATGRRDRSRPHVARVVHGRATRIPPGHHRLSWQGKRVPLPFAAREEPRVVPRRDALRRRRDRRRARCRSTSTRSAPTEPISVA